jgi:hypothetical protein
MGRHQKVVGQGVVLGLDDEMRRIDSDWYDEVLLVIALAAVCESQTQRAEEGMRYWGRRVETALGYLSNAGSSGPGAESPVLDRSRWQ